MKKGLIYFILLMAVVLAATVAYVSISGLLKVFSGAGVIGLVFFSAIEISKIVATSAIHTYGNRIGWVYNVLLSLGILIAMGITSMGVYGFLSSGYQTNSAKSDNVARRIELIDNQIKLKEKTRESINGQLTQTQKSIGDLRLALGNNTQSRVDRNGNVITTSSAGNRKAYEKQLEVATKSEEKLSNDLSSIDSTITTLSEEKLNIESEEASSNELGPLKYLADVTGSSMDNVMKWFILLLIVIGDPMAILMIIIFNKIINEEKNIEEPKVKELPEENIEKDISVYHKIEEYDENDSAIISKYMDMMEVDEPKKQEELVIDEPIIEESEPLKKVIRVEDLPEKNNRGFSVNIPERKSNNVVERIGSNKEVRDDEPNKVFFKKRK